MRRHLSRNVLALLAALVAVPLVGLSVAWACTALATIDTDHAEGARPGEVVNGTGAGFDRAPTASDVEVRLNGLDGPLLASVNADVNGRIAYTFTTPQAPAGDYVLVATQTNTQGNPVSGTPARAPFTILAAQSTAAQPAPAAPADRAAPPAQQPAPAAPAAEPAAAVPDRAAPQAARPAQPAPAVEAPAPAPAPAVVGAAPVPAEMPAVSGERAVQMAPAGQSLLLPLVMVATGLVLSVGTAAAVLATRRRDTPAEARVRR